MDRERENELEDIIKVGTNHGAGEQREEEEQDEKETARHI